MPRARRVAEFPWAALDAVERGTEANLRAARRSLREAGHPERVAGALSTLIGTSVEIVVRAIDSRPSPGNPIELAFGVLGSTATCGVSVEPALAGALLAALLRRPVPLMRLDAELDAALLGALCALIVEAARASGAESALHPIPKPGGARAAIVHVSVIVAGRPYVAALALSPGLAMLTPPIATSSPSHGTAESATLDRASLAWLSEVEVPLPLVVCTSSATPALLAGLTVGAAYVPVQGFTIDRGGQGAGVLVSGTSERGIAVEIRLGGQIVLGEPTTVALAAPEAMAMESNEATEPTTLEAAVLDAPLVVRIELGQVSLPAREWAALKPGDVIETGRRIAEPVVLRAGGRVLATGELVEIEGELGVRVLEIPGATRV